MKEIKQANIRFGSIVTIKTFNIQKFRQFMTVTNVCGLYGVGCCWFDDEKHVHDAVFLCEDLIGIER